jgi:hypothetical protein
MLVDFVTDSQVKKCLNIRFSKIALRPTEEDDTENSWKVSKKSTY